MAEKVYIPAIRNFKPNERAPQFILASMVIDVAEFNDWINNEGSQYLTEYNGKKQLRLTVLQSDKTGVNIQVDTYKPNK